jgi:hypothetical protein
VSRACRRAVLAIFAVGLVWAVSFVPIAAVLVYQVAPDSPGLELAGEIIMPLFAAVLAGSLFALAAFGALFLEDRLGSTAAWRLGVPVLVSAAAAGFQLP